MHPRFHVRAGALAAALLSVVVLPFPALASGATPSPSASTSVVQTTPTGTSGPGGPAVADANKLTFGIGPAVQVPADHLVDGRPYISAITSPGGVVRDAVALINDGRHPVTLTVYPADAAQNGSTTFNLSLEQQTPKAAGSWFELEGQPRLTVTVPASRPAPNGGNIPGRLVIPFSAHVPRNATPGDHAAAIVAELDAVSHQGKTKINLQQRIGVAVYMHLAGQLHAGLRVSAVKAKWKEPGGLLGTSTLTVSFTLTNTGDVRLDGSTLINTSRWLVGSVTSYPPPFTDLFPGSTLNVTETVTGRFGFGHLHTTVTAFGSPSDRSTGLRVAPASASVSFWAWPWLLIGLIVAIILVAILSWRLWRRWTKYRAAADERGRRRKPAVAPRRKSTRGES